MSVKIASMIYCDGDEVLLQKQVYFHHKDAISPSIYSHLELKALLRILKNLCVQIDTLVEFTEDFSLLSLVLLLKKQEHKGLKNLI